MSKRKRISTTERLAILKRFNAICHMCLQPIQPAQPWEVSHETPLELGGADDANNWKPAHKTCHREHTAKVDIPNIAKAKRREAAHLGARAAAVKTIQSAGFTPSTKRKSHPMPSLPPRSLYQERSQ